METPPTLVNLLTLVLVRRLNINISDGMLIEYKQRCFHDPASAALPRLTEPEEQQYRQLPPQLFQHLMLDRKRNLHFNPMVLIFTTQ
jgi:hypothetical protein